MTSNSDSLFTALNLPRAPLRIETVDNRPYVFDPLRRKLVALTPEEWVRQHFVAFLINHLGYPPGLTANEMGLKLNRTQRRADTVVFSRSATPLMIVEYKAPSIAITRKTLDQILRYDIVLKAPYIVVTNGLTHHCVKIGHRSDAAPTFTFLPTIPPYSEL